MKISPEIIDLILEKEQIKQIFDIQKIRKMFESKNFNKSTIKVILLGFWFMEYNPVLNS
jgi:hypothetical protein